MTRVIAALLFLSVPAGAGQSATPITASGASPLIRTDDVTNFYRVYDAAGGHPSADQLRGSVQRTDCDKEVARVIRISFKRKRPQPQKDVPGIAGSDGT